LSSMVSRSEWMNVSQFIQKWNAVQLLNEIHFS